MTKITYDLQVAKRIKELRVKHLQLTQEEFASKVNLTQSQLSRRESATHAINIEFLESLEQGFNVNKEWILLGELPIFKHQKPKKTNTILDVKTLTDEIEKLKTANMIMQININQLYKLLEKK